MRAHILTASRPARAGETLEEWGSGRTWEVRVSDGTEWKLWRVFPVWPGQLQLGFVLLVQDQACRYLECDLSEITWDCYPILRHDTTEPHPKP